MRDVEVCNRPGTSGCRRTRPELGKSRRLFDKTREFRLKTKKMRQPDSLRILVADMMTEALEGAER